MAVNNSWRIVTLIYRPSTRLGKARRRRDILACVQLYPAKLATCTLYEGKKIEMNLRLEIFRDKEFVANIRILRRIIIKVYEENHDEEIIF